jgi:cap1 methyltransferase
MGPRPNAMPIGELPTTGDITDFNVVVSLANAVKVRFNDIGATLYTSDVGVEVKDYNKQEEITAVLNYGQIISGILSLAPGGNLVTKQYTFVTPFSRSVIALVSYFFDKTFIVKPFTSRPLNSEVYLVGIGFQGIDAKTSDILLQYLNTYSASKSTVLSPIIDMSEVDDSILRAARQIHERQQVAFINEAIELYKQWGQQLNQLKKVLSRDINRVQQEWLSANPVKQIRDDQQLAMN